jgi:hypothetical protein
MAITITNILTISNSTTFSGTEGFTTKDYIQIVPNSTVTLKSGVTYTVTGQLTITGTSSQRCVLRSDTPISTTGSISTPFTLNTTSITVPTPPVGFNYIMSQSSLNVGILRRPVVAMNGTDPSLLTSFPVVSPGTGTSFTLSRTFSLSPRGVQIGLSAKFIHTASGGDTARNINFVNTFDIDSLGSVGTIKADNSYQNRVGIPNPNLWRTLNWDSLNQLLPNIIEGYIE